jgi:hypothetical protein
MAAMRERTLLVRMLLMEIALDAVTDAGHLEEEEIAARVEAMRGRIDAATVEEELLDGESGLARQLELSIQQARARRAQARLRGPGAAREPIASRWSVLADAYEALALMRVVDEAMFEGQDAAGRDRSG